MNFKRLFLVFFFFFLYSITTVIVHNVISNCICHRSILFAHSMDQTIRIGCDQIELVFLFLAIYFSTQVWEKKKPTNWSTLDSNAANRYALSEFFLFVRKVNKFARSTTVGEDDSKGSSTFRVTVFDETREEISSLTTIKAKKKNLNQVTNNKHLHHLRWILNIISLFIRLFFYSCQR